MYVGVSFFRFFVGKRRTKTIFANTHTHIQWVHDSWRFMKAMLHVIYTRVYVCVGQCVRAWCEDISVKSRVFLSCFFFFLASNKYIMDRVFFEICFFIFLLLLCVVSIKKVVKCLFRGTPSESFDCVGVLTKNARTKTRCDT